MTRWLWGGLEWRGRRTKLRAMSQIGILICTFDRPQLLYNLLAALIEQVRGLPGRVIVVDNGFLATEGAVFGFKASMDIVYDRLSELGLVVSLEAGDEFG